MAEVLNLTSLLRKLEQYERASQRENNGNVLVGYQASYAVYVHENLKANYNKPHRSKKTGKMVPRRGEPKQAKFLEQPARELSNNGTIATIVVDAVKKGAPLVKALVLGGQRIQAESQKIVPVDTGNLRGSAFTEPE